MSVYSPTCDELARALFDIYNKSLHRLMKMSLDIKILTSKDNLKPAETGLLYRPSLTDIITLIRNVHHTDKNNII